FSRYFGTIYILSTEKMRQNNSNRYSRGNNFKGNRKGGYRGNRGRSNGRGKAAKRLDPKLFQSKVEGSKQNDNPENEYVGIEFSTFGLGEVIAKNLEHKGYKTTTEIQQLAIPKIKQGKNILGISETGSGKTASFLVPLLDKVLASAEQKLIIVAPTRELASQIKYEADSLLRGSKLQTVLVVGGESMYKQSSLIRKGSDVIIGTPGRLVDLMKQKILDLSSTNNIVIDEVDRMMDMGFIKDIRHIYHATREEKQALFFSATSNKKIEQTVSGLAGEFETIRLATNIAKASVEQSIVYFSENTDKIELLIEILDKEELEKVIIFVETKHYADKINKILFKKNYKVDTIHGNKSQNYRKRAIRNFRNSTVNILVATNVAARGIDIDDVTHVINLDEPTDYEEYIHRIGRTGRNGRTGKAITFVKRG
ncbi:MAG: DEAD/DEAH box helicase, partial [Candidatus Dojkabacteria bacterium]